MLKRSSTPFLLLSAVMAVLALLLGVFMLSKPTLAATSDNNTDPQLAPSASMVMTATMPGGMGMMGANMPMTDTMPMQKMHRQMGMMGRHLQMMGQMMQMMDEMHKMMGNGMGMMGAKMPMTRTMVMPQMGMMDAAMPMTGTMPMGGMAHTGMMGRQMQMMGQMMQMMGEMHQMMADNMMGSGMMDGNMMDCMAMMQQMQAGMMAPNASTPAPAAPETNAADLMTQTAQLGTITVTVWPLNLGSADAHTLDFFVKLETHSGDLNFDLAKLAMLHIGEKRVTASSWQPSAPGGHHITGTLSFPAHDENGNPTLAGATEVELMFHNLGGHAEHVFTWSLR